MSCGESQDEKGSGKDLDDMDKPAARGVGLDGELAQGNFPKESIRGGNDATVEGDNVPMNKK